MKNLMLILTLFAFGFVFQSQSVLAQQWYKGNLHMHSVWSDGNVLPEQAIDWYKDRGYHFVSLTDHSVMQNNPNAWRTVGEGNLTQKLYEQYLERYGKDWVETRQSDDKTQVRLKPFPEFIEKLSIPDKFLIIPGHEQNVNITGREVHNVVANVVDTIPFQSGPTVPDSIRKNADALTQYGAETGRETLFISNHNCWVYFDIYPQDLIDVPEVRFFELLNCQPVYQPHPEFWSFEKFWDVINAFRLDAGNLPVYGIGQDDTHDYLQPGPKTRDLGNYWMMVRAESLTTENIFRAMHRGDFYTSSGVTLDDLAFDKATKTLSVKVKSEPGVKHVIRFNGTKKGFDKSTKTVEDPAGERKPARTFPVYSGDIGAVFKQVDGTEASYQMADDDLYVRVTVVSDREANYDDPVGYMPTHESAWSQPYCGK